MYSYPSHGTCARCAKPHGADAVLVRKGMIYRIWVTVCRACLKDVELKHLAPPFTCDGCGQDFQRVWPKTSRNPPLRRFCSPTCEMRVRPARPPEPVIHGLPGP